MKLKMNAITALIILRVFVECPGIIIRDGCGPGWDLATYNLSTNLEYCYSFRFEKNLEVNWFDAVRNCHLDGGELFVPENDAESKWIWDIISEVTVDNQAPHNEDMDAAGWFLNAHKQLYNKDYPAWADGTPLNRSKKILFHEFIDSPNIVWCDNSAFSFIKSCYYLSKAAYMQVVECGDRLLNIGYVCKKRRVLQSTSENSRACSYSEALNATCPAGWIEPPGKITPAPFCYKFMPGNTLMSFGNVIQSCKSMKSELISIDNKRETAWILSKLDSSHYYLLNLHRDLYGASWAMQNLKSPGRVGLTWSGSEPEDHCGLEECAALVNSLLVDVPCSLYWDTMGYICKMPKCNIPIIEAFPQGISSNCSTVATNQKPISHVAGFTKNGMQICKSTCIVNCQDL